MIDRAVVEAWDRAPAWRIHPLRRDESEAAYWASGAAQAREIAAELGDGALVVDFGCGDGRVAVPLAELGYAVIGVDSSPTHLGRLADDAVRTVLSDGTDLLALVGRQVDALICLAVLIHYDYASGKALIAEFADTVRPGGLLILDAPASDSPEDTGGWIGITTWDEAERDGFLAGVGFVRRPSGLRWPVYRRA